MNELIVHSMFYPKMEIQDAVKLLYQQHFGGGHLIKDKEENFRYLKEEYEKAEGDGALIEPIGKGISRLYLAPAKASGIKPELIHALFLASSEKKTGDKEAFDEELKAFVEACRKGKLPFDGEEAEKYRLYYKEKGFPPVSHSEAYREEYHPSYRIILSDYAKLLPLLQKMSEADPEKPLVIAIDGKCGSGKTTLAEFLTSVFPCDIIRMDDFFLPPTLRTAERLQEAGGNIHYERFLEEAAPFLREAPFSYRRFDCSVGDYNGTREITRPWRIVEGSYSMHQKFQELYDYAVFLDIDSKTQEERIEKRNGKEMLKIFKEKWIPMENRYFEEMDVANRCDLKIENLQNI